MRNVFRKRDANYFLENFDSILNNKIFDKYIRCTDHCALSLTIFSIYLNILGIYVSIFSVKNLDSKIFDI